MMQKVVRYSEAFKLQVIQELERGEVASVTALREKYDITGGSTVNRWLKRYGRNHLLPRIVRVETPEDQNRLKELKQENDRLKKALADSHMDAALHKSWLNIACEQFGVDDVEAFKKKLEKGR